MGTTGRGRLDDRGCRPEGRTAPVVASPSAPPPAVMPATPPPSMPLARRPVLSPVRSPGRPPSRLPSRPLPHPLSRPPVHPPSRPHPRPLNRRDQRSRTIAFTRDATETMGDRRDTKKRNFFRAPRDSQRSSLQETDHKVAGRHACRRHATEQNGGRRVTKKLFSDPPGPQQSMLSAVTGKIECPVKSEIISFKSLYLRPVSAK